MDNILMATDKKKYESQFKDIKDSNPFLNSLKKSYPPTMIHIKHIDHLNHVNYDDLISEFKHQLQRDLKDLDRNYKKLSKLNRANIASVSVEKLKNPYGVLKSSLEIDIYKHYHMNITYETVGNVMNKNLHICQFKPKTSDPAPIMIYCDNPNNKDLYGVYTYNRNYINKIISLIDPSLTIYRYKDLLNYLRARIPTIVPKDDKRAENKIAVKNGIFDLKNKKLIPFNPKYVFNAKLDTPFNPKANKCPILSDNGKPWTFDSFLKEAIGKDQIRTFWQLALYTFDARHASNKVAIFKGNAHGRNGKSTMEAFLSRVIGTNKIAFTKLTEFGETFGLSALPGTVAVISDNIASDTRFNKKTMQNMDSIATGDAIQINQKNRPIEDMFYWGQMILSINGSISFSDNQGTRRRLLVIRFPHVFKSDGDRVKTEFTKDLKVREYILYRALMQPYIDRIHDNKIGIKAENDMMANSDPVLQFVHEYFLKKMPYKITAKMVFQMYNIWASDHKFNSNMSTRTFDSRFVPAIDKYYRKTVERITSKDSSNMEVLANTFNYGGDQVLPVPVAGSRRKCYIRTISDPTSIGHKKQKIYYDKKAKTNCKIISKNPLITGNRSYWLIHDDNAKVNKMELATNLKLKPKANHKSVFKKDEDLPF